MVETTFYVTIEPTWGRSYPADADPPLRSVRATNITQKRSKRRSANGSVEIAMTVRLPEGVFLPLRPTAVIVVPEDMVLINEAIEVEAADAEET